MKEYFKKQLTQGKVCKIKSNFGKNDWGKWLQIGFENMGQNPTLPLLPTILLEFIHPC